jgi:hypothetical protein
VTQLCGSNRLSFVNLGRCRWKVEVLRYSRTYEGTLLGVCRPDVRDTGYQSSEDMWLLRGQSGDAHYRGRSSVPSRADAVSLESLLFSPVKFGQDDVVEFVLDVDARSLLVSVNGRSPMVLFDDLPAKDGLLPCAVFSSPNGSEKVGWWPPVGHSNQILHFCHCKHKDEKCLASFKEMFVFNRYILSPSFNTCRFPPCQGQRLIQEITVKSPSKCLRQSKF